MKKTCSGSPKYLFTLKEDYHFHINYKPIAAKFQNAIFEGRDKNGRLWLILYQNGNGTIKAGYSHDGASPKLCLFGRVIGTPDGKIDELTGVPITYHATLVHDALYQFLPHTPYSRKSIDDLFLDMLREADFQYAKLYHTAVRLFGGIFVKLTR